MMWATVGALATLELLIARVTGGPVAAARRNARLGRCALGVVRTVALAQALDAR